MAKWIRIETPDWHCEARVGPPPCSQLATWEEDRTSEQIRNRELPELRCDDHLPSNAEKLETEPQPKENVG